jgi:hypothetical protein
MKARFFSQAGFPRVAAWRQANHVVRKHLPLWVMLQVAFFGEVYFGGW